jgi:hypothetical protein
MFSSMPTSNQNVIRFRFIKATTIPAIAMKGMPDININQTMAANPAIDADT